ncbi:10319_t:CDS:2, partial [Diversispora eburnea]
VIDDKLKSPEIIEESAKNEPEISPVLPVSNESKSNNETPPQQISYSPGYQTREQREKHLRETAIKYGENPDKFMTIIEKDKDLVLIFKDKMISDAEIIQFAKDTDDDPDTLMDKDMDRQARLICIEIKIRKHEDDGEFRATPYDDEEWKKKYFGQYPVIDIPPIDTDEYGTIHPLADFYHLALILPLSTLAIRRDLCRRYPISVGTVVKGGMSLFTKEKNGKTSLENLIGMDYSSLSVLLEMRWEDNEIRGWKDNILARFLHHPNLILSKYRPNALYDAFSKAGVLGPEHILVIARTLQ